MLVHVPSDDGRRMKGDKEWSALIVVHQSLVHRHLAHLRIQKRYKRRCSMHSLTDEIISLHRALGIPPTYATQRGLPFCEEAINLVVADRDPEGELIQLVPEAARRWRLMKLAALDDGIILWAESGFRSMARQAELIRCELDDRHSVEQVLTWVAAPGYSEHHTGRAIDITSPDCYPDTLAFGTTDAFAWLSRYANGYGFYLSYPPDNPFGVIYEPWHWCLQNE